MGRFLNSSDGGKIPGRSILDVGVGEALKDAGFNKQAFLDRGGIFDWSRDEDTLEW
jgi:radical S-adenosyl methionine domain-containing protein 2